MLGLMSQLTRAGSGAPHRSSRVVNYWYCVVHAFCLKVKHLICQLLGKLHGGRICVRLDLVLLAAPLGRLELALVDLAARR